MSDDLLTFEKECWRLGHPHVAGVDEAGRGPLAGPVVVAAVVFRPHTTIEGVTDSKQLTETQREHFFDVIRNEAIAFQVEIIDHETIDRINILQASLLGMRRCVEHLTIKVDFVLIDGNHDAFPKTDHYGSRQKPIVKGDSKSLSIAAASILAKVTRDRLMAEYGKIFSQYDFAKNKGYPTPEHIAALRTYGMCTIHRRTFCAGLLQEQLGLGF